MPGAEFDLVSLYKRAFGNQVAAEFPNIEINGQGARIPEGSANTRIFREVDSFDRDAIAGFDAPVFMPVTIDGYRLPNEPLVEVSASKTIVKTDLAGYSGTIKENMGINDYSITIRGLAINNESDDYPGNIIRRLKQLFDKEESVTISTPILQFLKIDLVAIEGFSLSSLEGFRHVQPYEFQCISDRSVELVLKEREQENNRR